MQWKGYRIEDARVITDLQYSHRKEKIQCEWTTGNWKQTRSSWLNCALRDDEAVYWVSIGHYEAVAVGN